MIVDLETHKVVSVLKGRTKEIAQTWFAKNPQVKIVSRDRATAYASAAKDTIQIADRFHILKNLFDTTAAYFKKNFPARIKIEIADDGMVNSKDTPQPTKEIHSPNLSKLQLVHTVKELYAAENSIHEIRKLLGLHRRTIAKYIEESDTECITYHRIKGKQSSLTPFYSYIKTEYLENHNSGIDIFEKLQAQGFCGGYSTVKEYIRQKFKLVQADSSSRQKYLKQSTILTKVWENGRFEENIETVLFEKWPYVQYCRQMIDEFRTALISKSASYLKEFICQCDNVPFPIYNDFAKGLQVDFTAVQNAFLMPISNGVVEGNVNRLKAIKRQMYGRAGYDLLAKKVMYYCTN
jgi:hypothetical protein